MGNKTWFEGKKAGLFMHYLAAPAGNDMPEDMGVERWNQRVDAFDVKKLAAQLHQIGVDYFGITIGQNSGYYCSPNNVYDEIVGYVPSKCSRRDLVRDLYEELEKYGIDLLVYLPSGAPDCDPKAVKRLEWRWGRECKSGEFAGELTGERLASFQRKWESVIREWSERWGDNVKGWWIDGCYFSDQMYQFEDEPNFHSFARALRSGNEDAVLTFNTGTNDPFCMETEECDYTAGEVSTWLPLTVEGRSDADKIKEKLGGKKMHVLSYLGECWGGGKPRMSERLAAEYSRYLNEKGGMITWDIPSSYDGTLKECWYGYLKEMFRILHEE